MFFAISKIPKDVVIQKYLTSLHIDDWVKKDVFTIRWWIMLGLLFIALLVWLKLLHKATLHEICLYTVIAFIFVLGIDEYGDELTLWDYPIDVNPIFRPLTSLNLMILPLIYSLVYQYFRTRKSFALATIIITSIICFIIEPLLALGGFYQLLHWKYYFNFPIYVGMAILVKALVIKINSITEKFKNTEIN
jgi:hypothetical protein